ncbi:MAG: hypothetical protein K0R31_302 [Clostridiales bacterium]|jgi:tetraprenyl-beta-curcumene synthase|nr:hypothetical protein [Clostridiales bacterium]
MLVKYDYGISLVYKFVKTVFPEVDKQLNHWNERCSQISNDMLYTQALESISNKKFHAQGGSVFALYPNTDMQTTTKFIVSFQTISDYLDNLCDRAGVQNEESFRQLHQSMLDAVDLTRPLNDYYKYYPFKDDGLYLRSLVEECRSQIAKLPSFDKISESLIKYIKLYSNLQTYKHLAKNIREEQLIAWASKYSSDYPDITCWEFSAATGSTLGMFVLFSAASDPNLKTEDVKALNAAYFPWISGLHILLDYYIDAREDLREGDLNFTYYYKDLKCCEDRLSYFISRSLECCEDLPYPDFHVTVIKGLLAMYLSDPKAEWGLNSIISKNLIKKSPARTGTYHSICKLLRLAGRL